MDEHNDFEPSWGYFWGIRLLIAFAAVALPTIWIVGYYWDGITDRPTFITVNSLTVLAFVISIISAFTSRENALIARYQQLETKLQRKATESTVKLTESIVKEMQAQRELAFFQAAQTTSQLVSARDQVVQMIEQGETMREGLERTDALIKQTEKHFRASERPIMIIDDVIGELAAGEAWNPTVAISNSGRGTAEDIQLWFAVSKPPKHTLRGVSIVPINIAIFGPTVKDHIIFTGDHFQIDQATYDRVVVRQVADLYFCCGGSYWDSDRVTKFDLGEHAFRWTDKGFLKNADIVSMLRSLGEDEEGATEG